MHNERSTLAGDPMELCQSVILELSLQDFTDSLAEHADSQHDTWGAYADILRFRCTNSDKGVTDVVGKRLRFTMHSSTAVVKAFEEELRIWAKLSHPNVLPLLGYAIEPKTRYPVFVSEWMPNGSAWSFVTKNRDLAWKSVGRMVLEIASGLAYLHDEGVIHSDIKSDNVVISGTGTALICDFGSSRMSNSNETIVQLFQTAKGTAQFWAPELLGEDYHSAESDVWAFGMTIYELVNRKHPYSNAPVFRVIVMIMKEMLPEWPANLKKSNPRSYTDEEIYAYLRSVSLECWESNPRKRPQLKTIKATLSQKIEEPEPEYRFEHKEELFSMKLYRDTARMVNGWSEDRPLVKKALLIYVTYARFRDHEDPQYSQLYIPQVRQNAKAMQLFLNEHYGYEWANIELLTDENMSSNPTKLSIECAIEELVSDAIAGDQFVFVFSGHSSQVPNPNHGGMNSVIWPCDVKVSLGKDKNNGNYDIENISNYIDCDHIYHNLVIRLPEGTRLTMLFDCNFSQFCMALPNSYKIGDQLPANMSGNRHAQQRNAVAISSCLQNELTFQIPAIGGLLFENMLKSFEKENKITYRDLLNALSEEYTRFDGEIRKAIKNLGIGGDEGDSGRILPVPSFGSLNPICRILDEEVVF